MARLFLSLYIFIALILILLSSVLDSLFYKEDQMQSVESEMLRQMLSYVNQNDLDVEKLSNSTEFQTRLLDVASMSWSEEDKQALLNGHAISLFDPTQGHQFYIQTSSQQVLELTMSASVQKASSFALYSAIFYALLGGLIALWVWPLWRDLEKVKSDISTLNSDGSIAAITVSQRSFLRPIANAINSLSTQVTQLMLTQRELTGAVAHELRTPLSRLKFALAMTDKNKSEQWQAMHQDIDEIEKMVQEMLSFTSMEAHTPELSLSEIPLVALCEQIAEDAGKTQSDIEVEVTGTQTRILADEHYLHRAIENLVLNGCRYAKSKVLVTLQTSRSKITIIVDDDGEGIAPQWQEKIFEPFFRPDESRDRKRGGAGLGLAIVRRIVQWHQGQCWAQTSDLGGARFVIALPIKQVS